MDDNWRLVKARKEKRKKTIGGILLGLLVIFVLITAMFPQEMLSVRTAFMNDGISGAIARIQRMSYSVKIEEANEQLQEEGIVLVSHTNFATYHISTRTYRMVRSPLATQRDASGLSFAHEAINIMDQFIIEYEKMFAQMQRMGVSFENQRLFLFLHGRDMDLYIEDHGQFDGIPIFPISSDFTRVDFLEYFLSLNNIGQAQKMEILSHFSDQV